LPASLSIGTLDRSDDADGAERLIRQLDPDVVFVDIEMPGRDGLAVVDRLGGNLHGLAEEMPVEERSSRARLVPGYRSRRDRRLLS